MKDLNDDHHGEKQHTRRKGLLKTLLRALDCHWKRSHTGCLVSGPWRAATLVSAGGRPNGRGPGLTTMDGQFIQKIVCNESRQNALLRTLAF
jgi:hypothetical protein